MRTSSLDRNHEKTFWKLTGVCVLCAVFLFAGACAKQSGPNYGKKLPPKKSSKTEVKAGEQLPVEKEIIKKEPKVMPVQSTPKGRASTKLVEEGRQQLSNDNAAGAQGVFQQAITVDPNNGLAYYYLARAKFELGEYQQADGVLDKAEGLLEASPEWLEAIKTLRQMIGEKLAEKL